RLGRHQILVPAVCIGEAVDLGRSSIRRVALASRDECVLRYSNGRIAPRLRKPNWCLTARMKPGPTRRCCSVMGAEHRSLHPDPTAKPGRKSAVRMRSVQCRLFQPALLTQSILWARLRDWMPPAHSVQRKQSPTTPTLTRSTAD